MKSHQGRKSIHCRILVFKSKFEIILIFKLGLLFGKSDLLQGLRPYKLKACTEELPGKITQMSRWETGTINFEGIAGITAVIQYIASLGTRFGEGKKYILSLFFDVDELHFTLFELDHISMDLSNSL